MNQEKLASVLRHIPFFILGMAANEFAHVARDRGSILMFVFAYAFFGFLAAWYERWLMSQFELTIAIFADNFVRDVRETAKQTVLDVMKDAQDIEDNQ